MDIKALFKIQCGLFVAAVGTPEKLNGCITNTLMQQTHVGMKFAVTIEKTHLTHDMIVAKKSMAISALSRENPAPIIKRFGFASGRTVDKFADNFPHTLDCNGNPLLGGSEIAATFSLDVYDSVDVGTHTLFLCTPADMQDFAEEAITYSDYRSELKNSKK